MKNNIVNDFLFITIIFCSEFQVSNKSREFICYTIIISIIKCKMLASIIMWLNLVRCSDPSDGHADL